MRVETFFRLHRVYFSEPINSIEVSPSGEFAVTGGEDNSIALYHLKSMDKIYTIKDAHQGNHCCYYKFSWLWWEKAL